MRRVLERLLVSIGHNVLAAENVSEARAIIDREPLELLISDIGLPDGSGTDVTRYLKDRQSTAGIAVSGFGQDEDIRAASMRVSDSISHQADRFPVA